MITLDNYHLIEESLPVISQQIGMKATGATIHKLKTHEQELHGAIWGLQHTTKHTYYLDLANRAKNSLERFGIHIIS